MAAPSLKEVELSQLRAQLAPLGLVIRPIAADGNCLFRAVHDQLVLIQQQSSLGAKLTPPPPDHATLRKSAADHIRLHPSDFGPFLPYEPEDGYPEGVAPPPAAVQAAVNAYCVRMARPGIWGGHPELRALATALLTPITIHESGAPPVVIFPMTDDDVRAGGGDMRRRDSSEALQLSFHRHYYALGEHYNSVARERAEITH